MASASDTKHEFTVQQDEQILKYYIPHTLAEDEPVRAIFLLTHDVGIYTNRWVDDPIFRSMAARAKIALGPGPSDEAARLSGRPEMANLPIITFACSAQGRRALQRGLEEEPTTAAVIAVHGPPHAWVVERARERGELTPDSAFARLPVLHAYAGRNWVLDPPASHNEIMDTAHDHVRSEVDAPWTAIMEAGSTHCRHSTEAMKLLTLWVQETVAQRVVGDIPADGKVELAKIDPANGWLGAYRLVVGERMEGDDECLTIDEFVDAEIHPYGDQPGDPGDYTWLPSEEFARAWLNYHKFGNVAGDPAPRQVNWPVYGSLSNRIAVDDPEGFHFTWFPHYFTALNLGAGPQDVTWSLVDGELPPGTELLPNGRIRPRVEQPGLYEFTLRAEADGRSCERRYIWPVRSGQAVHPNDEPVLSIESPADGARVAAGEAVALAAEADRPLVQMTWHSSIDGELGTGATLSVDSLSPGRHLITALGCSDEQFEQDADSVCLTVGD